MIFNQKSIRNLKWATYISINYFFFQGSGADMDAPHSHIFKCPRCGGSGKEKLKAGPISTSATCIKCEGRGTFVTAICKFVRMTLSVSMIFELLLVYW